jgi:hypothetical protein
MKHIDTLQKDFVRELLDTFSIHLTKYFNISQFFG